MSLYFTTGRPSPPQNCPFPWGHPDPNLIHGFLGPLESSAQTASRFSIGSAIFAGLTSVTDQLTDHATQLVTTGRIYIYSTEMRPSSGFFMSGTSSQPASFNIQNCPKFYISQNNCRLLSDKKLRIFSDSVKEQITVHYRYVIKPLL